MRSAVLRQSGCQPIVSAVRPSTMGMQIAAEALLEGQCSHTQSLCTRPSHPFRDDPRLRLVRPYWGTVPNREVAHGIVPGPKFHDASRSIGAPGLLVTGKNSNQVGLGEALELLGNSRASPRPT